MKMEINAHIWKRRSGKTFKLVNDFLKSPDDSFIVVHSYDRRSELINEYNSLKPYENHIISSRTPDKVRGHLIKHLYVDEYYFVDNVREVVSLCSPTMNEGSLNIYSSLPEYFGESDLVVMVMVHNWKLFGNEYNDVVSEIDDNHKQLLSLIKNYWLDYITEPRTNFISNPDTRQNENLGELVNYGKG